MVTAQQLLMGDIFRTAARAAPQRIGVTMGERQYTFAEMDAAANRAGHLLRSLGIGHQDRVVMWSNSDIDAVPLFGALAKLGAVFAPANALLNVDEATEMVGLARPSALVVDEAHFDGGAEIARRLSIPLLTLREVASADQPADDIAEPALRENDTHVLFFTSGSTGKSKGVILSHRVNFLRSHPGAQISPRGATACMYPLFHMGAWTLATQSWQHQQTFVLVGADPVGLVDSIERWGVTHFNAIPAVWRRVIDHVDATDSVARLDSLRVVDSGTSATPPDLLLAIKRVARNAYRRVYYGSTEAGAVTHLEDADMERKPGSCGNVSVLTDIKLDDGNGEMLVRGALLFDGYFDNPEATAEAFTADGYFRTGDVAAIDDEGFYSIVGRAKDVIRTGGETVSPSEVELTLTDIPAFLDVAVVGIPDPQWGETVCVAAVLREGAVAPTLDEVVAHCEGSLAKFKRPRRLEFVREIPRTPATNQVKRRFLIEEITSR